MEQLRPAFPEQTGAIVFSANDYFCPYLAVMLYSVLEHAAPENQYDIVILHRDISLEHMHGFWGMLAGRDNVSLRFCDVSELINGVELYTGGKEGFTVDCYSRLLIPDFLSEEYTKALYLDGDMLAMTDIYPLIEVDLEGFLLASTRDLAGIAGYYYPFGNKREYRDNVLKISNPNDYFISGMLVLNLPALRDAYTGQELLKMAASQDWMQHDQDVLNVLCNGGKAKILHASWDVLKPYKPECLPPDLRRELDESIAAPKIVHFGGEEKPWKNTLSPWMSEFWATAVRTPFYQEIIFRILEGNPSTSNEATLHRFERGEVGFSYIIKYTRAWLRYKLRKGKGNK